MPSLQELLPVETLAVHGRGPVSNPRLEEHLAATRNRLRKFGVHRGDCVASVLPDGPDATTALLAVSSLASFSPLPRDASAAEYESLMMELAPKLLLMHPGAHPARDAAQELGIPVANVLRHFEAGVFTLEAAVSVPSARQGASARRETPSIPLVFIGNGLDYRRMARHMHRGSDRAKNNRYTVIGITPPGLEHLPPPHTIEHVAAECVRMLKRYRTSGPYALAGTRADSLVALEMARLLQQEGESVIFVALLDAQDLFYPPTGRIYRSLIRAAGLIKKFFRVRTSDKHDNLMEEAMYQYRPHPWHGRILNISPANVPPRRLGNARFESRYIAPYGFAIDTTLDDAASMTLLIIELDRATISVRG